MNTQTKTLRDEFAMAALPIAWDAFDKGYTADPDNAEESMAKHAYQLADAMLEARKVNDDTTN